MKLLILFTLVSAVFTYKLYQTKIPNGELVKHPCLVGELWPGVGHINVGGGGTRNPFGTQFSVNNYNWTAVCGLDADGDGVTNGAELGDPNCVWTEGQSVPAFNGTITHPGVCEPMESTQCQTQNRFDVNCDVINHYECEVHDAGVFNVTYRFDRTKVPTEETTYICQRFEMPDNRVSHLIGSEPLIDNENIMHHMLAFGCSADTKEALSETPTLCFGMPPQGCSLIGGWAFGESGPWCPHGDIGQIVGQERYKYLYMQYHWNNPTLMDDQYDESAFKFFFTSNIRAKNATTLVTGNQDITIPANTVRTAIQGTCSSECTQNRIKDGTMYIYAASPHMHLLGSGGSVVQKRNGQVIDVWLNTTFDYNTPTTITYDPPKELKGGDEIYTECLFNSENRASETKYGDGTQEEMCFMFMSYYPETVNLQHCVNGFAGSSPLDSCLLVDYYSDWNNEPDDNSSSQIIPSVLSVISVLIHIFTK